MSPEEGLAAVEQEAGAVRVLDEGPTGAYWASIEAEEQIAASSQQVLAELIK